MDSISSENPTSGLPFVLSPEEARVLGCLLEKEIATPEYYPMTLNALTNACNQKSNRRPVMALETDDVNEALDALREKKLAVIISVADSRVPKFKRLTEILGDPGLAQRAVLCELLVRGPQTAGELRTRCERLRPFVDIAEVEKVLVELEEAPPGSLVKKLPRQAGRKESRYTQLLTGGPALEAEADEEPEAAAMSTRASLQSRIETLEKDVAQLRAENATLKEEFDGFRRQFE